MRQKLSGTRLEVAMYCALMIVLAVGALILSDLVLGVGAAIAAIALFGALSAQSREPANDDEVDS